MKRRLVVAVALAAALAAVPASAADGRQQTFELDALRVAFRLPSNWARDLQLQPGWQWQAVAPRSAAHLYVNSIPTKASLSALGPAYAREMAKPYRGNPHLDFASSPARVASVPAIKITFRFRDLTHAGFPLRVATTYVFVHKGRFFVFDYITSPKLMATLRPVFEQSIRSVRFLPVT